MFGRMEQVLEHWRKSAFACIYSCVGGGIDDVLEGTVNGCIYTVQAERGKPNWLKKSV